MNGENPMAAEPRGFCRNCGTSLTAETLRDVRGVFYCENCLAQMVAKPQPTESTGNPTLAAILGFVPGLGAVYNGEYLKAVIHVLIFGSIIAFLDRGHAEGFFIPLLIIFIFYMPFEAYRTAKAKASGLKSKSLFGDVGTEVPVGPAILIGLGFLLLLDKFDVLNLDRIADFFVPFALIGLGGYLLRKRMSGGSTSEAGKQ